MMMTTTEGHRLPQVWRSNGGCMQGRCIMLQTCGLTMKLFYAVLNLQKKNPPNEIVRLEVIAC